MNVLLSKAVSWESKIFRLTSKFWISRIVKYLLAQIDGRKAPYFDPLITGYNGIIRIASRLNFGFKSAKK